MTTTLTPTTIGDQIVALPPDLANSIAQARTRFDAMKKKAEEEEDPEEEADESDDEEDEKDSKMSFFDKMKAAKAAKSSKKDSDDVSAIFDRIDSLEAENEVLASLVNQEINEDAEGHKDADDEDMTEDMTPQEIAIQLVTEFEKARPFLPPNASVANYADIYDIYEDAIETRSPGILLTEEMSEDDGDRVDPTDADELRGAFKMLRRMANPMQMQPSISMDSADRSFAEALGLRSDGCGETMPNKTVKRTEYY